MPNSTESVNEGHPDKICDQFSDVVFDACLTCDAKCKVASETCVKDNMFMVTGEITVAGKLHHETVVRGVMSNIELDSSIDDFSSVDSRRLSHQDCARDCFRLASRALTLLMVCASTEMTFTPCSKQKVHSSRTEASSTTTVSNSKPPTSNNGNKQGRQEKKRRKRVRGERVKEDRRKNGTLRNKSASSSRGTRRIGQW